MGQENPSTKTADFENMFSFTNRLFGVPVFDPFWGMMGTWLEGVPISLSLKIGVNGVKECLCETCAFITPQTVCLLTRLVTSWVAGLAAPGSLVMLSGLVLMDGILKLGLHAWCIRNLQIYWTY